MSSIFTKKFRILLKKNECSPKEISDYTGISRSTIYRWLSNDNKITPSVYKRQLLADFFSVDVSVFNNDTVEPISLEEKIIKLEKRIRILEKELHL